MESKWVLGYSIALVVIAFQTSACQNGEIPYYETTSAIDGSTSTLQEDGSTTSTMEGGYCQLWGCFNGMCTCPDP